MGLDMYAWGIDERNVQTLADTHANFHSPENCPVRVAYHSSHERKGETFRSYDEVFYWRKHYVLHEWMENLYKNRGGIESFNCVKLRIYEEDLNNLEKDIITDNMPQVLGIQYEYDNCNYWLENDLLFIAKARETLKNKKLVFYDSWW